MARLLAVGGAEALVLRPRLLQRLLALLDLAARILQVGLRFFYVFGACMGHSTIGHDYISHTYLGHNYIGHDYRGPTTI